MKTNIFKLSLMALAAAFITSCSQDEELAMGAEQPNVLNISATVKEYTPDAETRVTDTEADADYTTSFENNDCIGVYVVVNGETVIANRQLKFDSSAGKWTPPTASDEPLYYYKDAQYIAYSPYNAELALASGEEKTIAEKIKDYFVGTVWTAEATKNDYSSCDLMIATYNTDNELPSTENVNAAFEFSHVMSMVEYWIPAKTYTTKADGTGYSYSGIPMSGLKFEMKAADWEEVTPISIDGIRYRILLDPDAEENASMYFGGQFDDNGAPVYFRTANAFTPAAGTFKKVTVTRNGYSFEPTVRPIEVGDYYYSDGNIVPSSESTIPEEINGAKCIGIVYKVSSEAAPINIGGKTNACVIALQNHKKYDVEDGYVTWWKNKNDADIIPRWDGTEETYSTMIADLDGYGVTQKLKEKNTISDFETINYAANSIVPLPEGTTGWYLPTLGEIATAFANLSGKQVAYTSSKLVVSLSFDELTEVIDIMFKTEKAADINYPNNNDTFGFWTCTDRDDSNAWALAFEARRGQANGMFAVAWAKEKQAKRTMCFRPVFAF